MPPNCGGMLVWSLLVSYYERLLLCSYILMVVLQVQAQACGTVKVAVLMEVSINAKYVGTYRVKHVTQAVGAVTAKMK